MSAVKTKPILFNGDMVRAILDGKKTVTRRKIENRIISRCDIDTDGSLIGYCNGDGDWYDVDKLCKYQPNDILWVRESFAEYKNGDKWIYIYKECDKARQMLEDVRGVRFKWRPSIHMPKEAARIFLWVTDVDVQHLQDMTNDDALKEGFEGIPCECENAYMAGGALVCTDCYNTGWQEPPIVDFMHTWNQCAGNYERYGWDANPWVWVIEFERIKEDVYERNVGG